MKYLFDTLTYSLQLFFRKYEIDENFIHSNKLF